MVKIKDSLDIEYFLAQFEDPVLNLDQVMEALDYFFYEAQLHQYTDSVNELKRCFIHKLLIKAYRLGKEHGYAGAAQIAKKRSTT